MALRRHKCLQGLRQLNGSDPFSKQGGGEDWKDHTGGGQFKREICTDWGRQKELSSSTILRGKGKERETLEWGRRTGRLAGKCRYSSGIWGGSPRCLGNQRVKMKREERPPPRERVEGVITQTTFTEE